MTLLEEVKELDGLLKSEQFKSWSYARLTISKVIKLIESINDKPSIRSIINSIPAECQSAIDGECHLPVGSCQQCINHNNSVYEKFKNDRDEYEILCMLNKVYPLREEVDWYWHFNELKNIKQK